MENCIDFLIINVNGFCSIFILKIILQDAEKEACAIRDAFPNFKKLKINTKQYEHYNITPNNTKYNFCVFLCVLKILVLFSVYVMRKKK
jgi:hypothetical protein